MSNPEPTKQTTPEQSGPRIYETETPAKSNTSPSRGVYDAPTSRSGPSIGLIIGIIVVVLIVLYLLVQFVF